MTKTIPNYLRIHRGPAPSSQPDTVAAGFDADAFWDAYQEATGWRIERRGDSPSTPLRLLPSVMLDAMDGIDTESLPPVSQQRAEQLAEAGVQLTQQLKEARQAIRGQEIELATRASILVNDESRQKLSAQIETTLADAAAACQCDAAIMYLLDDDTQNLKARSVFGISPSRLDQPPRPLRGSRGDLEALVQGVVTIDDFQTELIDTWNSPEPFAAGICVAIRQDDVPIGTLWLFANQTRSFAARDEAAARLAASQLSIQLSQAAVGRQQGEQKQTQRVTRDIGAWQYDALPIGAELAEGWRVDGMIESQQPWATGWHAWDVLPDGSLLLAMAEAEDESVMGALSAAVARAALTAHTGYRHTPRQLMQRVHDTLWNTSTSQQLVSLLYARVDPETGEGEVASAGKITAMIGNRYGYRPVVDGVGQPLTSDIDPNSVAETFRMARGETLLAYGPGVIADGAGQSLLGNSLRTSMERAELSPLARLRRKLADHPLKHERGLVSLLRTQG